MRIGKFYLLGDEELKDYLREAKVAGKAEMHDLLEQECDKFLSTSSQVSSKVNAFIAKTIKQSKENSDTYIISSSFHGSVHAV